MRERPIIFSGEMVRAILEGRKTMTRRVVKCHSIYSLTDDRVYGILTENAKEDTNERHNIIEWSPVESNTNIAKRGLYGGFRREDILANAIQRIWAKGIRGLVSVTRTRQREGLSDDFSFAREQKDNKERSQIGLPCLSRIAETSIRSGEASGRKSTEQCTAEPSMGNARRELDGQENTWPRERGGEAPNVEVDRCGTGTYPVDNRKRNLQSTALSKGAWNVAGFNIRHSPYQTGLKLWVRETWAQWFDQIHPDDPYYVYKASCKDEKKPANIKRWKPSIYMPRWASRITLEITNARVERLQEITEEDVINEGVGLRDWQLTYDGNQSAPATAGFAELWDSINGKKYPWESNPWVWVIEFRRLGN